MVSFSKFVKVNQLNSFVVR